MHVFRNPDQATDGKQAILLPFAPWHIFYFLFSPPERRECERYCGRPGKTDERAARTGPGGAAPADRAAGKVSNLSSRVINVH